MPRGTVADMDVCMYMALEVRNKATIGDILQGLAEDDFLLRAVVRP